jgi:hypothetical protein
VAQRAARRRAGAGAAAAARAAAGRRAGAAAGRAGAALAVGILAAFALVAAAFLFRPEPPAPEVATSAPVEAAPATTPAPAADPAAFAAVSTVRLRVGQAFPEAGQAAILAALAAAGLGDVRVELQPFAIATSRVGYYRAEDLAAAEALGRLAAEATGGGAIEPRDYSQLLPDAEPGRLDLWIGG